MKASSFSLLICILVLTVPGRGHAQEGTFYIAPLLDVTWLRIDNNYLLPNFDDSENIYGPMAKAGYRGASHFVIEVGAGYSENLTAFGSTFDNYELSRAQVAVGYTIGADDWFRIEPKIGINRWRLHAEEGIFFNPGPEDHLTTKGTDVYTEVNLQMMFNDLVGMDLAWIYSSTDFGNARSFRVGVRFEF